MAWSEDSIHRWLARAGRPRGTVGSAMHDAAVLARARGRTVACLDQTVEGVHFEPGAPPRRVGAKAARRALSDLAATAARPRALLLGLAAPPETEESWIRAVIGGLRAAAREVGAELVGGDLCASPGPRSLAVTALGELPGTARPPGRGRARAGQAVLVTGPLGGSLLGRHLGFRPRLEEGRWLHGQGATAMMDVSDGLAWDLHRLARAAGVRIVLECVPVHAAARRAARASGRTALDHALHDGEDHELIATVDRGRLASLLAGAPRHCPGLAVLGRVEAGSGLVLAAGLSGPVAQPWDPARGGWRHGS